MEDLQNLKYKDLQKLAKAAGIKANSPKADLIKALKEVDVQNNITDDEEEPQYVAELENLGDKVDVEVQNKLNETYEKENSVLNVTFDKEDEANDSQKTEDQSEDGSSSRFVEFMDEDKDEISFRRSTRLSLERNRSSTPLSSVKSKTKTPKMDYLSKGNKTPLRKVVKTPGSIHKKSDSNIPRFMKFATKGKTGKVPNFAKIHAKNSDKLESLDDYLDKKNKLTDTVKKQLDKAKALAVEHSNIINKVKNSLSDNKFVPAVTSTAKMNLNFGSVSKPGSSEPFKFNSKPVAAAPKVAQKERKDIKATTKAKIVKPVAKKPISHSPKPLLNITNTNKSMNVTDKSISKTPGKKFDLKASLKAIELSAS